MLMALKKIEEFYGNRGLIAQVSDEFREMFQNYIRERGQKQKDVIIASLRIWMSLPLETQARLINQSTSEVTLSQVVEDIIDKKLKEFMAGQKPARTAAGVHKKDQEYRSKTPAQLKSG